ncbi:AHNK protein, partial [Atrichornis clamosus]|nr:AHNK protein [Atrichornis clamosus]
QMEKEEETREILLPNWQGSGSHGITIDQTDDGVFVKRVQQNSPAARMGVVKEGDQIVSATVYFDNLQTGEVAQLLQTMGHHTVGLRLQRRGDRSPLPGQPWPHDVFTAGSPEVVLSGDDEEYRRIYTTKIKPRLRSEEGLDAEGGGTQSRTITVTRKVTAYTVDVAGGLDAGPDLNVRIPTPELPSGTTSGADAGKTPIPTGAGGIHLRTQTELALPESQIPGGETGNSVALEMPGWKGSGAFPGSPRVEANGQMGELERGFHLKGPRLDGKGHVSGVPHALCPQGEVQAPGVDGSSPPVDVGKIKIPVLKIPKFGFQTGGEAQAPQVGADLGVPCSPGLDVSSPSIKASVPQVDVGLKGAVQVPSPQLDIPGPGMELPAPESKGKIKIPHMTFPKFSVEDSRGDSPTLGVPKGEGALPAPKGGVTIPEVALKGEWKGPAFKKVETPQISLSDVNLSLRGPQVKGELGVPRGDGDPQGLGPKGLKVDVKAPEVAFAGPEGGLKGVSTPEVDVHVKGLKGGVDVPVPSIGGKVKGPQLDLKGPQVGVEVPSVDIKGPTVKVPEVSIKTPQISMPDIDLNLKGPGVKGNVEVSTPKLEGELKAPGLDIKGPKVEVEVPDLDVQGPEGKLKFPKLKMPKFGVKGETPNVDVTLPEGGVDISGPKVDVDIPSVDVKGPKVDIEAPNIDIQGPEGKFKMPTFKMPKFGLKGEGPEVDVNLPKGDVDVSLPRVDVEMPSVDVQGPEGKVKVPEMH